LAGACLPGPAVSAPMTTGSACFLGCTQGFSPPPAGAVSTQRRPRFRATDRHLHRSSWTAPEGVAVARRRLSRPSPVTSSVPPSRPPRQSLVRFTCASIASRHASRRRSGSGGVSREAQQRHVRRSCRTSGRRSARRHRLREPARTRAPTREQTALHVNPGTPPRALTALGRTAPGVALVPLLSARLMQRDTHAKHAMHWSIVLVRCPFESQPLVHAWPRPRGVN